jgi:hypothetical protein
MKILILCPLFPPDVGAPAPYCKELASRLSGHSVTLLVYGYLPESVPGVEIVTIDKRHLLPERLFEYTSSLRRLIKRADVVIVNNGPSTELPALLVSLKKTTPLVLCKSDPIASAQSTVSRSYALLQRLLIARCLRVIALPEQSIYQKPEVHPFKPLDEISATRRETWWQTHITELTNV